MKVFGTGVIVNIRRIFNMSLLMRAGLYIFQVSNCKYTTSTIKHAKRSLFKSSLRFVPVLKNSTKSVLESPGVISKYEQDPESVSFSRMVESRRNEAQRSIIVQVHSEQSCSELYAYCSQFGAIKGLHHYVLPGPSHFVLVEFSSETHVKNILNECVHSGSEAVPVQSPFLWFRAGEKAKRKKTSQNTSSDSVPIVELCGNTEPAKNELCDWMLEAESLSDQMLILHRSTRLGELGSRLRFITAHQIELALRGLFPLIRALPFGSSVNGFGRLNCDLDLVLQFDKEAETSEDSSNRLVFHVKTSLANGRSQIQRHMETIGDVCQRFLPGCSNVKRILHARVPIIKYRQDLTNVDCDLSMTNMTAVHMSELLYVLGEADPRVRPLVCTIRWWAREVQLTNLIPGHWITNFSLSLLVLFFLQQTKPLPVLPTLNKLIALSDPRDRRMSSDGVNCTFTRNTVKLRNYMINQGLNEDSLETLLINFFEFYSAFDFSMKGISLVSGTSILKPEHSALYIVNPLEHGLNVSKNVNVEEMERLRIELRNAAWCLEGSHKRSAPVGKDKKRESWGLVAIFQAAYKQEGKGRITLSKGMTGNRLMEVSELFSEEEVSDNELLKPAYLKKQEEAVVKVAKGKAARRKR